MCKLGEGCNINQSFGELAAHGSGSNAKMRLSEFNVSINLNISVSQCLLGPRIHSSVRLKTKGHSHVIHPLGMQTEHFHFMIFLHYTFPSSIVNLNSRFEF
jgi:hypothetical protein